MSRQEATASKFCWSKENKAIARRVSKEPITFGLLGIQKQQAISTHAAQTKQACLTYPPLQIHPALPAGVATPTQLPLQSRVGNHDCPAPQTWGPPIVSQVTSARDHQMLVDLHIAHHDILAAASMLHCSCRSNIPRHTPGGLLYFILGDVEQVYTGSHHWSCYHKVQYSNGT